MLKLSNRAQGVTPSATIALAAKAKAMKAAGEDVVGFTAGEPDFDTPEHIKQAAIEAIRAGDTKYTPNTLASLREAVVARVRDELGLEYTTDQVVFSCGAKHSLYYAFQAIVDPGDEVIVISPYWLSYPESIRLAGGTPVFVKTMEEDNFQPDPEKVAAAISERTVALVINSPCNPTGAVYDRETLQAIVDVCDEHDVRIISDEIYDKLLFDGREHVSPLQLSAKAAETGILVNGASKTYAMTGWRFGWALGPADVIKAMSSIQSHASSPPAAFTHAAVLHALTSSQEAVEQMRAEFEKRRNYMSERISRWEFATFCRPAGTFYAFPRLDGVIGQTRGGKELRDGMAIAEYLLESVKVAVVPGGPFGAERNIRLCFATSMEAIEKGLERIEQALG